MLGQNWMNEALGSDADPDPTREGETASISSVVEGFLRNDAGFSRPEVTNYINRALQNEMGDATYNRTFAEAISEAQQFRIDLIKKDTPDADTEAAEAELARDSEQSSTAYDNSRSEIAEAMFFARDNKVFVFAETSQQFAALDHDGYLSKTTGVDIQALYGANPAYEAPVPMQPLGVTAPAQTQPSAGRVDFGREVGASAQEVVRLEAQPEPLVRDAAGPAHAAPETDREPIKAGRAVGDLLATLKRNEQGAVTKETGPELG